MSRENESPTESVYAQLVQAGAYPGHASPTWSSLKLPTAAIHPTALRSCAQLSLSALRCSFITAWQGERPPFCAWPASEPRAQTQQQRSCFKAARISCHVRPLLCISASVCSSLSFSFYLSFWKAPSAADHVGIKCTSSTLRKHTYTDPHANGVSFSIRVPACACLAGCIPRSLWSSDHLRERAKV